MKLNPQLIPAGKPAPKPKPMPEAVARLLMALNQIPNPMDALTVYVPLVGRSFTWLQGRN